MSGQSFRHFVVLVIALAVGVMGVVIAAQPASAAGCRGSSCTGKNPQAEGCSRGARTVDEFTYLGVRFELRYSPACRAEWTRVTSSRHHNTLFAQIRGGGKVYGVQVKAGDHWTKMISSAERNRACRAVWFTARSNECTSRH